MPKAAKGKVTSEKIGYEKKRKGGPGLWVGKVQVAKGRAMGLAEADSVSRK
jgi:hypothetical protein